MKSYGDFAALYDRLMSADVDYGKLADYIEDIFEKYGREPELICDLACGTGSVTAELARRGYNMTGVDSSEEMLNIAAGKSHGLDVLYLNQRMEALDLYGTMGAFLCLTDGINYILAPESLMRLFKRMKSCFMDSDALFIFDVSTRYKLRNIIGSNTFVYPERDIFYVWQNRYIEKRDISDMFLTFFERRADGAYRRFEERHLQRAWTEKELRFMLSRAGFAKIDVYGAMTFEKPEPDSERIVFICQ